MSWGTRRRFVASLGPVAAAGALPPETLAATRSASTSRSSTRITNDLSKLEAQAKRVLDPDALGYIVASAGDGATARANVKAFEKWRIVSRKSRKHETPDLSTTILGTRMPAPVLFGPVGVQKLAHPDGELATARAADALQLTYVHSTQGAFSMEEVAAANGRGSRWYQLYWPNDDELCVSFLQRAQAADYSHLVITLDTTMLGWRPADLDRGYLPFLANLGIANYTTDPVFRRRLAKPASDDPIAAGSNFSAVFQNPGLSWDQLPLIRKNWDGPILLKGIQSVADAKRAVKEGIDGIVVSNHGGRQIDGAIASLDALPAIADAAGNRLAVLFDFAFQEGDGGDPDSLDAELTLRDALTHPDLAPFIGKGERGITVEERGTDLRVAIPGGIARDQAAEIEEALWDRLHFATHLRSEQLGTFTIGDEAHRSASLALVQLLILYHLVTARAGLAVGGVGSRVPAAGVAS